MQQAAGRPAVDGGVHGGDEADVVATEVGCEVADLFWFSDASDGVKAIDLPHRLRGVGHAGEPAFHDGGVDEAGADRIDADAHRPELLAEAAGDGDDAPLGGGVGGQVR